MQLPTTEEALLIERGMAAENLLRDPTFGSVLNTLMQQYLQTLMATGPEQEQVRNACYYSTKAVQGIEATLNEWLAIKEQIANNLNDDETSVSLDDEEDY